MTEQNWVAVCNEHGDDWHAGCTKCQAAMAVNLDGLVAEVRRLREEATVVAKGLLRVQPLLGRPDSACNLCGTFDKHHDGMRVHKDDCPAKVAYAILDAADRAR